MSLEKPSAVDPVLRVEELGVTYHGERGAVYAVDGVSFAVQRGGVRARRRERLRQEHGAALARRPAAVACRDPRERAVRWPRPAHARHEEAPGHPRGRAGNGLPGPYDDAQPGAPRRRAARRDAAPAHLAAPAVPSATSARSSSCAWSESPRLSAGSATIRTSSAAGCGSASSSPSQSPATRTPLADEPTTALYATIQDQISRSCAASSTTRGCSMILVSHDLGVIAKTRDHVAG